VNRGILDSICKNLHAHPDHISMDHSPSPQRISPWKLQQLMEEIGCSNIWFSPFIAQPAS